MMDGVNTEAIFYSASYTTKSGWKVMLQLPDEEAAKALDAIGAGQRYMVAMVPISDDEKPDKDAMKKVRKSPAQMAGILCKDKRFWECFGVTDATKAAEFVRSYCGVKSRSELKPGTQAARRWDTLTLEFGAYTGRIAAPR